MSVIRSEGIALASKFRGCLTGALLGDCLGSPFEFEDSDVSLIVLQKYFDKLEGPYFKSPQKPYSDDSAMTRTVAQSFIHNKGFFDAKDLASRFVKDYYAEPNRGYGGHVIEVFHKLKAQKCTDPFKPASEQFNGTGSYGNGGAMRVAPVALVCYKDFKTLLETARDVTKITHTHPIGINGALLQCIAIHQGLLLDPEAGPLDVESFTSGLITKMTSIECVDEMEDNRPYLKQLQAMQKLLSKKDGISVTEVQNVLGNDVSAIMSVPTAIFSFLYAQNPIPGIKTENKFRRTIQYAISIGGDTDTIASMAGAIAGAYFGDQVINESLKLHCEGADEMLNLAKELNKISE